MRYGETHLAAGASQSQQVEERGRRTLHEAYAGLSRTCLTGLMHWEARRWLNRMRPNSLLVLRLFLWGALIGACVPGEAAAAVQSRAANLPTCASALSIPKVAIMFLAREGMPLEKLWEAWFQGLEGLVPTEVAHDIVCRHNEHSVYNEDGLAAVEPCVHHKQGTILQRQYLFSVYVHSSRLNGWSDFDPGSVFFGTLLPEKYEASWGDTTPATRAMLRAGLADPLNSNFMLLSDSDIPLYPATLVYQQLVHEQKSRVASCWPYDMVNIKRYTCAMEAEGLGMHHWRKSALWFTMPREHAKLAAYEEFVYGIFRRHCTNVQFDDKVGDFRGCLTDEHVWASLFAYYNKAKETDCLGVITIADFTNSVEGHPRKYLAEDVDLELIQAMRTPIWWLPRAACDESLTREARNAFIEVATLQRGYHHDHCNKLHYRSMLSFMEQHCQLFARKFDTSATLPLLAIFTNQSNEALLYDNTGQIKAGQIGQNEFLTRVVS